jgi:DNA primase RepB-like protein/primase-like protein
MVTVLQVGAGVDRVEQLNNGYRERKKNMIVVPESQPRLEASMHINDVQCEWVEPDALEAERFLQRLGGDGPFTFQTYSQVGNKKRRGKILHGTLAERQDELIRRNKAGQAVTVMVNEGDLKGRTNEHVVRVRAVWVDLDGAPLQPVLAGPLVPHIVVESSPRRFHAYWLVEGVALQEFQPIQQALARRFGADLSVSDLGRGMRMPGFVHQKGKAFKSRIVNMDDRPRYSKAELVKAFGIEIAAPVPQEPKDPPYRSGEPIPEGRRNHTLFGLASGFRNTGLTMESAQERLAKTNKECCQPPLPTEEVEGIVLQAYKYPVTSTTRIPNSLLDSPEWRALSHNARSLLLTACRIYNGGNNGNISLAESEMQRWGFSPYVRRKAVKELLAAKLIYQTREAVWGQSGKKRQCALYGISFHGSGSNSPLF